MDKKNTLTIHKLNLFLYIIYFVELLSLTPKQQQQNHCGRATKTKEESVQDLKLEKQSILHGTPRKTPFSGTDNDIEYLEIKICLKTPHRL